MDPEIRAQWVAALRSGNYRQGKGTLRRDSDGTFCCLGVLCELAVAAGVTDRQPSGYGRGGWWSASALPISVQEWAGLANPDPRVFDPLSGRVRSLASLNDRDTEGRTFDQIAVLIEEYL